MRWRSVPTAYGLELKLELWRGRGYREYGRPTWDRMPEDTNVGMGDDSCVSLLDGNAGVWTRVYSARSPHGQRGPGVEA